jgi:outer membrane protein OmpA-like peptidoglycan-associated protein
MGAQGPSGLVLVEGWSVLREVRFNYNQANIRSDQAYKVSEVVSYMQQNPSLRVGIDSFDPYNQALGQRRVDAVRDALINAGLPAYKIQQGGTSQSQFQCSENFDQCRRVGVLINSGN